MDYQAKQMAKAAAAKALQAANPFLVPVGAKDSLQTAAANVRIELKRAFPGVKFSIKTSRFSGGDSLRVRWIDGPTTEQVDAIANKYAAGRFDGMTDCYDYEANAWTDAFGDAKFVSTEREYSDQALANAIRTVSAQWAGNLASLGIEPLTVTNYRTGQYYRIQPSGAGNNYWSLESIIFRTAAKRTYALNKTPKALPMMEADEVAA